MKIPINVSNISAIFFVKTGRRIPKPRSVHFFGEPTQWIDTPSYLGVTLDKRLSWSTNIDQLRKKAVQGKRSLHPERCFLEKQLIRPPMD
jgi:hypothetical protein